MKKNIKKIKTKIGRGNKSLNKKEQNIFKQTMFNVTQLSAMILKV